MLRAKCLTCGAGIKTRHSHLAGTIVSCPKCGGMVELPKAESSALGIDRQPTHSLEQNDATGPVAEGAASAGTETAVEFGPSVAQPSRILPWILRGSTAVLLTCFLLLVGLFVREKVAPRAALPAGELAKSELANGEAAVDEAAEPSAETPNQSAIETELLAGEAEPNSEIGNPDESISDPPSQNTNAALNVEEAPNESASHQVAETNVDQGAGIEPPKTGDAQPSDADAQKAVDGETNSQPAQPNPSTSDTKEPANKAKTVDVAAALELPIAAVRVKGVPLAGCLEDLQSLSQAPLCLDLPSLHSVGLSPSSKVSLELNGTTIQGVLNGMAKQNSLVFRRWPSGLTLEAPSSAVGSVAFSEPIRDKDRELWRVVAEAALRQLSTQQGGDIGARIEEAQRLVLAGPREAQAEVHRALQVKLQDDTTPPNNRNEQAATDASGRLTKPITLTFNAGANLQTVLRAIHEEMAPRRLVLDWESLPHPPAPLSARLAFSKASPDAVAAGLAAHFGGAAAVWDKQHYWIASEEKLRSQRRLRWKSEQNDSAIAPLWSETAPDGDVLMLFPLELLSNAPKPTIAP